MFEQFPNIKKDQPLAPYCTFQIGGPADYFYILKDLNELPELIKTAQESAIPYFIFGSGSNLLFSDEGFRGLVIKIEAQNYQITDTEITADAGVLISKLLAESIQKAITGLEQWVGLPGTVGAAVRGNAGCNGLETKDILIEATLFNPETAQIHTEKPQFFQFDYRESRLKYHPEIVLQAKFRVHPRTESQEEQMQRINEIRKVRLSRQPPGCSTGSFFKNPSPDTPAGLLIDQAGLKGYQIGGAQISEKHGNFFLNKGQATAKNIIDLAAHAQNTIKKKFHIDLEPEVQIVPSNLAKKSGN